MYSICRLTIKTKIKQRILTPNTIVSKYFQVFAAHYFDLELPLADDVSSWEAGDEIVVATTDYPGDKESGEGQNEVFTVQEVGGICTQNVLICVSETGIILWWATVDYPGGKDSGELTNKVFTVQEVSGICRLGSVFA